MTYIELGENNHGVMIYGRVDEDGLMRVTCTAENGEYQAWLNPIAPYLNRDNPDWGKPPTLQGDSQCPALETLQMYKTTSAGRWHRMLRGRIS